MGRAANAATIGPWFTERGGIYDGPRSYLVAPTGDSLQDVTDAEFIAHTREDIPFLLGVVGNTHRIAQLETNATTRSRVGGRRSWT